MSCRRLLSVTITSGLLALAAQAQSGHLRVISQPGVTVTWEGVELGSTGVGGEFLIESIPLGTYDLVLAKPDHERLETRVEIVEGRTTVSLKLTTLPSLSDPEPAALDPVPREDSAVRTTEPSPPGSRPPTDRATGPAPVSAPATAVDPVAEPTETAPIEDPEIPTRPDSSADLTITLLTLGGLLVGLLLWTRARARREPAMANFLPEDNPELDPEGESEIPSVLHERLRRREAKLDSEPRARRIRAEESVIDISDFEVIEENK